MLCCLYFGESKQEEKITLINYQERIFRGEVEKMIEKRQSQLPYRPPVLSKEEQAKLVTCEVCGYKAICPDSTHCYNCVESIFDTTLYQPEEKLAWLKDAQCLWFWNNNEPINFFEPNISDGFKKDPKWRPSVTKEEVKKAFEN